MILLSSCITPINKSPKELNEWIGKSNRELINKWGYPDIIINVEKYKYGYQYTLHNYTMQDPSYKFMTQVLFCQVIFHIQDSVITDIKYEGSDCSKYEKNNE